MIVIASDKFKGTFTAEEICRKIGEKVSRLFPESDICIIPMADGGEGTAKVIAGHQALEEMILEGRNPYGLPIDWKLYSDGKTAAIDSAAIVGRQATINVSDPMNASSYPLGALVRQLACKGIRKSYVGVGGTMTTDGGTGFLQGVGWRFFDKYGKVIDSMITPRLLSDVYRVIPPSDNLLSGMSVVSLMDVDVPLLPSADYAGGLSALSFAPQKGVKSDEIMLLEQSFVRLSRVVADAIGKARMPDQYCGAGGGLGFALQLAGSAAMPGAETVWEEGLADKNISLHEITRIYTGEGCLDEQSLQGKVTGTIMRYGCLNSIPVTVVCGRCELPDDMLPAGTDVRILTEFL